MSSRASGKRWKRDEPPLYVGFSVAGAERLRLEALAASLGYPDPRTIAGDVFRVGLQMTFARYELVTKKCRTNSTSRPSSERRRGANGRNSVSSTS